MLNPTPASQATTPDVHDDLCWIFLKLKNVPVETPCLRTISRRKAIDHIGMND